MTLADLQHERNSEIQRLLWLSPQIREIVAALRFGEIRIIIREGKLDMVQTTDSIRLADYPKNAT